MIKTVWRVRIGIYIYEFPLDPHVLWSLLKYTSAKKNHEEWAFLQNCPLLISSFGFTFSNTVSHFILSTNKYLELGHYKLNECIFISCHIMPNENMVNYEIVFDQTKCEEIREVGGEDDAVRTIRLWIINLW